MFYTEADFKKYVLHLQQLKIDFLHQKSKYSYTISRRYFTKLSQMRYATTILADLTVTFLTKSLLFTVPKTVLKYISRYVVLVMP